MLGIQRPEPVRKVKQAKANKKARNWKAYEAAATLTVDKNAKLLGPFSRQPYGAGNAKAIEALATLRQVRDRIVENWRGNQELPYETKAGILKQVDEIGEKGDLQYGWINNIRGRISEALFGPHGGGNQQTIPNPLHPVVPKNPPDPSAPPKPPKWGLSRLDDLFGPRERRPDVEQRQWLEEKSSRIDGPPTSKGINWDAVADSRKHTKEGRADWDGLLTNDWTREDGIVIHYAFKPVNEATKAEMLKELLGPESAFSAVQFGDEPWIERTLPMPEIHPKLRDGPLIVKGQLVVDPSVLLDPISITVEEDGD
jgi:hypothetical protein